MLSNISVEANAFVQLGCDTCPNKSLLKVAGLAGMTAIRFCDRQPIASAVHERVSVLVNGAETGSDIFATSTNIPEINSCGTGICMTDSDVFDHAEATITTQIREASHARITKVL